MNPKVQAFVNAFESVATDIRNGVLTPGTGTCFDLDHEGNVYPRCSIGHGLLRAGFDAKKHDDEANGWTIAASIALGRDPVDMGRDLCRALDALTIVNDNCFSKNKPRTSTPEQVAAAVDEVVKEARCFL